MLGAGEPGLALHGLTPDISSEVAHHVPAECQRLDYLPEVRLYVDKALRDFQLWREGETETHWRDLVTSAIQERATELRHELRPVGRAGQIEEERAVANAIAEQYETRAERLAAWQAQTGKSERAFYRRLQVGESVTV